MKKKKSRIKKVITIIAIFLMNGLGFMNAVYATSSNFTNLDMTKNSGQLLKYENIEIGDNYTKSNEQEEQNNSETVILHINQKDSKWKQDNIDKKYMSKTYNVTSNKNIKKYKIDIDVDEVKITNNKNQEKTEFEANEEFKVLVPIKNMTKIGTFKLVAKRSNFLWYSTRFFREWMCFNNNL